MGAGVALPPPQRVYVSFSAELVPHTAEALIAACANLANAKVPEVYLLLSTPGGSVMHGMNVYNALRAMPFNLITHNVGNVDSIGNVVFLAGKDRYACDNATFMFHGVGMNVTGNQRMELKNTREVLDGIRKDNRRISNVIAQRATFANLGQIERLFLEARTKDATWALQRGIIHDIRDVQIPAGAPIQQLVFQR